MPSLQAQHLLQGSPGSDAGAMPGGAGRRELTVDVDGNARTQDGNGDGTAVRDIGAFEAHLPRRRRPTVVGGPRRWRRGRRRRRDDRGDQPRADAHLLRQVRRVQGDAKIGTRAACLAGKVKVFEKAKGKDPKVGADKTNSAGKWSFEDRGADGKLYATVCEDAAGRHMPGREVEVEEGRLARDYFFSSRPWRPGSGRSQPIAKPSRPAISRPKISGALALDEEKVNHDLIASSGSR